MAHHKKLYQRHLFLIKARRRHRVLMAAHIFARLSKRILHQCCSPDQGSKILPFVWKLGMLPVGEALLAEHKLHPKIQRCHSNTGPTAHRESMRHSDISPISVVRRTGSWSNPRPCQTCSFWHLLTSSNFNWGSWGQCCGLWRVLTTCSFLRSSATSNCWRRCSGERKG